jgi:hypothetical protein
MDKSFGQLLIGAVLGAVAIEVLREKKPELLDKIKSNTKDIVNELKSVYSKINTAVRDWAQSPS